MSKEPDPRLEMPRIQATLRGKRPALFLDFDGTLSPIVPRPEDARALPEAVAAIKALRRAQVPVVLVTGRARDDLLLRVLQSGLDPDDLLIAGSHGYEIEGPNINPPPVADAHTRTLLSEALRRLRDRLADMAGVAVEPKAYAVAVHWRHVAPEAVPALEAIMQDVARGLPGVRKTDGKMVFELRPATDWHKGSAIAWILSQWGDPGILPIFIGDDTTDIDGLAAVKTRGIGIAVGPTIPEGHAAYRLPDPEAVAAFLAGLLT